MRDPKTVQIAQMIAEAFPQLLVERTENTVTLEDTGRQRFVVTVESTFNFGELRGLQMPESDISDPTRCPACESPEPRLHPATQSEGEVKSLCADGFHAVEPRRGDGTVNDGGEHHLY